MKAFFTSMCSDYAVNQYTAPLWVGGERFELRSFPHQSSLLFLYMVGWILSSDDNYQFVYSFLPSGNIINAFHTGI